MTSAVRISLVLCVAIYFAVGFFGYLLFGDSIMADMLVNFDQNSDSFIGTLLNIIVRLSYAVHLMLVFPVMNYSLRVNVDELFFPKWPLLSTETVRFLSLTGVLLAFMYLAAIAIPNIWYFFQFMGTTTVMCLMFIFPSSIILRCVHISIFTSRDANPPFYLKDPKTKESKRKLILFSYQFSMFLLLYPSITSENLLQRRSQYKY